MRLRHSLLHWEPRSRAGGGDAAKVIAGFATEGYYDLIVIGHSDHSELWGRRLGGTADRISDHAHCSVLRASRPGSVLDTAPGRLELN